MAGRDNRPDIRRPNTKVKRSGSGGRWKTVALWGLGGATVFFGIVGGALWWKYTHATPEERRRLIVQSGIPTDFFGVANLGGAESRGAVSTHKAPPVPPSEYDAPPAPPAAVAPGPTPAQKVAAEKAAKCEAERLRRVHAHHHHHHTRHHRHPGNHAQAIAHTTPPHQPVQLFTPPSRPRVDPRVLAFNAQRAGAESTKVAHYGTGNERPVSWINSTDKWREQRTISSYPLKDMTRIITADENISAVLVNAINSEIGGKVVAQVEENIYGAAGRKVLIPAGSKAIGKYVPLKKVGDTRINIIWSRIITPQGINIHVGNAEMTDAMGRAGLAGDVNEHYWKKYGMALMVSTLTAATTYPLPVKNAGQAVVIQAYGQGTTSMANEILNEHIKIKPTVTIPAGARIMISPQRDIWFPPPKKAMVYAVASAKE